MKTKMTNRLSKSDYKAQLALAESELDELIERAQILGDYVEVLKKLSGKKASTFEQQLLPGVMQIPRRRTKGLVLASQITEVIKAAGHPMHVRDIVKKLGENGNPVLAKNPTNTVAVAMIRRADQFVKVSPNTFDLVSRELKAADTA
jgi:HB1, ASXL, restriction endonuclease HTH domain